MHRLARIALAAAGLAFATPAFAIDFDVLLPEKVAASLSPEAKLVYADLVDQNDRANWAEVARLAGRLAELSAGSKEVQFFALARASDRAEVFYSANSYTLPPANMDYSSPPWNTSEAFLDIAEAAVLRLNSMTNLSEEERRRVANEAKSLEETRATIITRDEERMKTSMDFLLQIRGARLVELGKVKILEAEAAAKGEKVVTTTTDDKTVLERIKEINPFQELFGEARDPWLPAPPPPPEGAGGAGGGRSPFGPGGLPDGSGIPPAGGAPAAPPTAPAAPPPTSDDPFDS